MVRVIIAAVLGGVILFVWSFVSWMFIPWHLMGPIPGEDGVRQTLRSTGAEAGVYWVPGMDREITKLPEEQRQAAEAEWQAKYEEGPVAMIVYRPAGSGVLEWTRMATGLGLNVGMAAIAAIMLSLAVPALPFYRQRLFFVFLIGVYTLFGTNLMHWNWMNHPLRFSLEMAADTLVSALLLALVLAAVVKPAGYSRSDEVSAI